MRTNTLIEASINPKHIKGMLTTDTIPEAPVRPILNGKIKKFVTHNQVDRILILTTRQLIETSTIV